jgi:hypothetical protein
MLNVITTTRTLTRKSGETVEFTEWAVGGYTLRKIVEAGYTDWAVTTSARNLPYVGYKDGEPHRPIFGVSVPSSGELSPLGALTLAKQITEAAHIAATFNMIAADN